MSEIKKFPKSTLNVQRLSRKGVHHKPRVMETVTALTGNAEGFDIV